MVHRPPSLGGCRCTQAGSGGRGVGPLFCVLYVYGTVQHRWPSILSSYYRHGTHARPCATEETPFMAIWHPPVSLLFGGGGEGGRWHRSPKGPRRPGAHLRVCIPVRVCVCRWVRQHLRLKVAVGKTCGEREPCLLAAHHGAKLDEGSSPLETSHLRSNTTRREGTAQYLDNTKRRAFSRTGVLGRRRREQHLEGP